MNIEQIRQTNRDFVPSNASLFHEWANSLLSYITPAKQAAWSIPKAQMDEVQGKMDAFSNLQNDFPNDPTRAQIKKRNAAQREAMLAIRYLVRFYLRRDVVTDPDLIAMGIPPISHTRTLHINVTETVAFEFRMSPFFTVTVDFWQAELEHTKAKPNGYMGAEFIWNIGSEEPASPDDYRYKLMLSRRPHRFVFDKDDRGKTVWFAARWQNARGNTGVWSPAQSTIIP